MRYLLPLLTISLALFVGCAPQTENSEDSSPAADAATSDEGAGHVHEGDDVLFWQREGLEHGGCTISLGHHGAKLYEDHEVEPAVAILRDDQPVGDAEVFVSLADADGNVVAEETACTYEPPTDDEPAHYAQAKLSVPAGAKRVVLRYRIEIPGSESMQQDVPVDVASHD